MSGLLSVEEVYVYLECISEQGCEAVNQSLEEVAQGGVISEIKHLPPEQQSQVIDELEKVMLVYRSSDTDE